jgi:hypothetical protein
MFKVAEYAIDDTKMCARFFEVSLKGVQTSLQKIIAWTKKFGK